VKKFLFGMLLLAFASFLNAKDTYSIAFVNLDMDYREYDEYGQIFDSEQSDSLKGAELSYERDLECDEQSCSKVKLSFLGIQGDTDYIGAYLGSGLPYGSLRSTTKNKIYDLNIEGSKVLNFEVANIVYGIGLGYHSWYRELSSYQNERYTWFYVAPIIGVSKDIIKGLNIAASIQYKYGLRPKMVANAITNEFKLGGVNTLQINIPVRYELNEYIDIFTEYVYVNQKIKKSDLVLQSGYFFYEPKSTDNQNYLKVGISFKY
jgi:hypothetical protein